MEIFSQNLNLFGDIIFHAHSGASISGNGVFFPECFEVTKPKNVSMIVE